MINAQTSFKNSKSYRQENILILLLIINSFLRSKDIDISLVKSVFFFFFFVLSLFLLKYLLLEGRKGYLFENLNAKNTEKSDKLQNNIRLLGPRYKGLNCLIVV